MLDRPWGKLAFLLTEIGIGVVAATNPLLLGCLVLPPLLLFTIMCGVAPRKQRDEARRQRDDCEQRNPNDRRHVLGLFLGRGDVHLKQAWLAGVQTALAIPAENDTSGSPAPYIEKVANRAWQWKKEVAEYLEASFGNAEVALFWSDVGIPDLGPVDFDESAARKEANTYRCMQRRIFRLQELLERTTR